MTAGQRWSTQKPTVPGWYWWRWKGEVRAIQLAVLPGSTTGKMYVKGGISVPINALDCDGEWQGPLTPNEATT